MLNGRINPYWSDLHTSPNIAGFPGAGKCTTMPSLLEGPWSHSPTRARRNRAFRPWEVQACDRQASSPPGVVDWSGPDRTLASMGRCSFLLDDRRDSMRWRSEPMMPYVLEAS